MRKLTKLAVKALCVLMKEHGHTKTVEFSTVFNILKKKMPKLEEEEIWKALKMVSDQGFIFLNEKRQSVIVSEIADLLGLKCGRFSHSDALNPRFWELNENAVCLGCDGKECRCESQCVSCHLCCPYCPGASKKRKDLCRQTLLQKVQKTLNELF